MDFLDACRKFIELDSTPQIGTLEIAQYAAELCRKAGLEVELQTETVNGLEQANVIARPSSEKPAREFMLQTHLDTCDPGAYAHWTKTGANPFQASVYRESSSDDDEILYGLGTANAKLDFICKLEAISQLSPSAWKVPPVLVGTFGEETGMHGAIRLIRKKKISADMALIGEPTGLGLVGAGKGFAGVEIEVPFSDEEKNLRAEHDLSDGSTTQSRLFKGRAAHSSAPELGESAILKMIDSLTKLPDGIVVMEMEGGVSFNTIPAHAVLEIDMAGGLKDTIGTKISKIMAAIAVVEKEFEAYPDTEFAPSIPTLSIGLVRTYEDFVKLSGCCRLPPSVSNEVYERWMEILRDACDEIGAVFRVTDYKQPFRTPANHQLIDVCQEALTSLNLNASLQTQSVANEASVFSRFGLSCVVVGPGNGVGNSHAPNEHIYVRELKKATQFYKSVLEKVCL